MANVIDKVLVVGGAGYIGGGVTDVLLKRNIPFAVYDSLLYANQYLKPVEFIYGDVRDTQKLAAVLPEFSHVIWLAAIVGDAACEIRPDLTVSVNQGAVEWLARNYKGRIIFLSTCSVYGRQDAVVDENSPAHPLSLYAKTKLQAEKYLEGANRLIFRLGTAFGVSDDHSRLRMDLVVNYMTASALTKKELKVFGGTQWRPLIHAKDIARIIVDNLAKETQGIYNLTACNMQIKDVAETVAGLLSCPVSHTGQLFEDKRNYAASSAKGLRDGVFTLDDTRGIDRGIEEIAGLIRSGRVKYVDSDIYYNERHLADLYRNGQFT